MWLKNRGDNIINHFPTCLDLYETKKNAQVILVLNTTSTNHRAGLFSEAASTIK